MNADWDRNAHAGLRWLRSFVVRVRLQQFWGMEVKTPKCPENEECSLFCAFLVPLPCSTPDEMMGEGDG